MNPERKKKFIARLKNKGAVSHSLVFLASTPRASASGQEEEVDVEIDAEEAKAWINGTPLELSNGKGSTELLPGHHVLSYEVRGAPGTTWSVKITAPKEAQDQDGDTFDASGFEAGRLKFVVGA